MNILIAYSSKTGNTKKLAMGIYNNIYEECDLNVSIKPIDKVKCIEDYDAILIGYWVDKGVLIKRLKNL